MFIINQGFSLFEIIMVSNNFDSVYGTNGI